MSDSGSGARAASGASAVDWAEVRRRVEASAGHADDSADAARDLLRERARRLAQPPEPPPAEPDLEVVRFRRGGETLLVESQFVRGVFALAHQARLPRPRPPVVGIGVWHGELLLLADVRADDRADPAWTAAYAVVLGGEEPVIGLLADELTGVESLPGGLLHPVPGGRREGGLIRAVTDHPASVVDADLLLRTFARSGG